VIRVVLPAHLRTLANVHGEVTLDVEGAATQRSVLDALEAEYPMLKGTLRDPATQERRKFVRFFAQEEDLSHEAPDTSTTRRGRHRRGTVHHRRSHGRRLTGSTTAPGGRVAGLL
jgi:molybdopterin synthase sulfur carrier subunit